MSDEQSHEKLLQTTHRDDLDQDVVEELETVLGQLYPDAKVVFAADMPGGLPEELQAAMAEQEAKHMRSVCEGRCLDCDSQMENWPPPESDEEPWDFAEGWRVFAQGEGDGANIVGFQCPICDAKEENELG